MPPQYLFVLQFYKLYSQIPSISFYLSYTLHGHISALLRNVDDF